VNDLTKELYERGVVCVNPKMGGYAVIKYIGTTYLLYDYMPDADELLKPSLATSECCKKTDEFKSEYKPTKFRKMLQ